MECAFNDDIFLCYEDDFIVLVDSSGVENVLRGVVMRFWTPLGPGPLQGALWPAAGDRF